MSLCFNVSSIAKVIWRQGEGGHGLEAYPTYWRRPDYFWWNITYICMYQNQIILQGKMIGMQKYDENHLVF